MIAWLSSDHYKGFIAPSTSGIHPTHVAFVDFDGHEARAFVKLAPRNNAVLFNECVGYLGAKLHELKRPPHAAIIELRQDQLPPKAPAWARDSIEPVRAWACEELPGKTLWTSVNPMLQENDLWREVLKSRDGGTIAALDHWISNADRHRGNLMRLNRMVYAVIDHSEALGSHMWPLAKMPIAHSRTYLQQKAAELLLPEADGKFRSKMVFAAEKHGQIFNDISPELRSILSMLHPTALDAVIEFMASRSTREWMADALGVV